VGPFERPAGRDVGAADFEGEDVGPAGPAKMQAVRALNVMPPSAAMAGVYASVDAQRGVWKAPANVSLNGVTEPVVAISQAAGNDLNVSVTGKSVNAIRAFPGEGVLVWGARTLDGNSQDWRYVPVRRTMIFVEESCRVALQTMVFQPNDATTWVSARAMIETFLENVWKQGGLAGVKPQEAFFVRCGLGETMTQGDIDDGVLRVTIGVAALRAAEFVAVSFEQRMQAG
jgi:phage tail sheath protein FI